MIRLAIDGQDLGEFSEAETRALCEAGDLTGLNVVFWREGMTDWQPLSEITYTSPAEIKNTNELTDEYHQQNISLIEMRLKALKRAPRIFADEIENAQEQLASAKDDRQTRKEERDGDIQWWVDKFSKESIEEFMSEEVEPYLKVFKKPTKAQIKTMVAYCEKELAEELPGNEKAFFDLYEKLFPDVRKAPRAPAAAQKTSAQRKTAGKKKSGCLGIIVASAAAAFALTALAAAIF